MPNLVSSERNKLHVIKASAGSGKTHRLTGEYLRLLFSGSYRYRHILAVTFTNKATDEMKSRIVQELHSLASGAGSSYLHELMQEYALVEQSVRTKAKDILENILHDYSSFSVSTIDRFFQQTMRAFTREMGLSGGYNIELDEFSYLTETVELMLSELGQPESKQLSDWLLLFMRQSVEEGKSWKIDRQIVELARELTNETYKSFSGEDQATIHDKEHLLSFQKILKTIIQNYKSELKEIGKKGVDLMSRFDLHFSDFSGGNRSPFSHFIKWANGELKEPTSTFCNLADNPDKWTTKTTLPDKRSAITSAFSAGLNDVVKEAIVHFENSIHYKTAESIRKNFYTLGILNDIKNRLRKLQQENNTLFLSDTTELLNQMIAGTDSPFIYEKTGTRIAHYMMDEFQDTSRMQWRNFKPLIVESTASGNMNLIVGDVKQSIYRFRNSDWSLLERQIREDFHSDNILEHILDTNWRSDRAIVQFNNAFFLKAPNLLQQNFNDSTESDDSQIIDAYRDAFQHVPPSKSESGGQVKITFLKDIKEAERKWKEESLEQLPYEIEQLQDQGFALHEIAVVVRRNKEATAVAKRLLDYKKSHPESSYRYDIISDEALLIGSAQTVKATIAIMRHFRNPEDKTRQMIAAYEFNKSFHPTPVEMSFNFRDEVNQQLMTFTSLPFYDMVERLFALFSDELYQQEYAYIQAFLDIALKFSSRSNSDLDSFLDWWDEKGKSKAISSPEGQDAIRIMTIHKSKGLGFGAVIMPFVNWETDYIPSHTNIIWCKPEVAPFNQLRVVPLKYGNDLKETIFRKEYLEEKRYNYIDNLNLLYVAFTRAKHRLILFAPQPKKTDTIKNVADLLWQSVIGDPSLSEHVKEDESATTFNFGYPSQHKSEKKMEMQANKSSHWHSVPFDDRLKLRLNSIGYFSDEGRRDYGKMMHDIVSNIETLADIPRAVEQKISAGELGEEEKEKMINQLNDYLSIPAVSDWYSGKYKILNETQLLHPVTGFSRPDRVMIAPEEIIVVDYKFGDSEDNKYNRQVRYYMKQIKEMGYQRVSGYIFYVKHAKIIPVS
jgi:ATP-dependent helicase/nuclease subunit A